MAGIKGEVTSQSVGISDIDFGSAYASDKKLKKTSQNDIFLIGIILLSGAGFIYAITKNTNRKIKKIKKSSQTFPMRNKKQKEKLSKG